MITIENGDLFDVKKGIICHQVNCSGAMGRGVAAQFRDNFPKHFEFYKYICKKIKPIDLMGKVLLYEEQSQILYSCSMFAQIDWRGEGCKTNYFAFRDCCKEIKQFNLPLPIYMPLYIGCGLAGGDWNTVYKILEEEFKDQNLILRRRL